MTLIKNFQSFLKNAPTSYHAVEEIKTQLAANGFIELKEDESWTLKNEKNYFCIREGSLIAFKMPKNKIHDALIFASHTDSPSLKLKPHAEYLKEGMVMWGIEVYGAPLLSSWLNRDLGVAGKVLYENNKGEIKEALINLKNSPCTIPQLAIHLDREVNDKGLILDKQEHLNAIAAIDRGQKEHLLSLLKKDLPLKELLAHDLFLYPLENPEVLGDFFASYRLDSLASVFAILTAFLENKKTSSHKLQMMAFWDHEEIGSGSATGAESPFFSHILERVAKSREEYLKLIPKSLSVSVDLGHSVHPNYPDRHDSNHKPKLGDGVLIKTHAQKKYATDVKSIRCIIETAKKNKIPFQMISCKNTIPSGSTIGPIHAALTGIPTVDIGIGQLSMHSTRELIASKDLIALQKLIFGLTQ